MGGGGIKDSTNQLKADAAAQKARGDALGLKGDSLINEGQEQQAPLVNFLKSIIGGNSTTTNQALAPVIGNITAGAKANRANIYDTSAPGAGRDIALAENERSKGTGIAGATNSVFLSAFPQLASLASGNTSAGLGLTGAGITSTGNSASTTGNVLNAQEQQKSNQLSALTGLAGVAGGIATGGVSGLSKLFNKGLPNLPNAGAGLPPATFAPGWNK